MIQGNLFGQEFAPKTDGKYTGKIQAPIYEPKNQQPHILELLDNSKTQRLINRITAATNITEGERKFLLLAAQRHTVFNYERIADYYANATPEMQELMEDSALVIIDFLKAIELGYVQLCENISQQYLEDYGE